MADSGFPEISSIAVMNRRAITNTMAAVPAMVCQLNDRRAPGRPSPVGPAGCIGRVVASIRSVAGALRPGGRDLEAIGLLGRSPSTPPRRPCRRTGDADGVGDGEHPPDESASPVATVAPSLRSSGDESGARTTTCLTACWPRSIDWATNAVREGGGGRPDGHADDGALDPEGGRDDRRDDRTDGGGQDLADRELHAWSARTGRRGSGCAHSPTAPSICSRSRSACPLCRAYSSIMWIMIQRREKGPFPANADERVEVLGVGDDGPRHVALALGTGRCPPWPGPARCR